MSDQDIFKDTVKVDPNQQPPANPFDDKLKTIVDDTGKPKYETVDKALEALTHSQAHIKTLEGEGSTKEAEIKRLREELEKRSTVEDFVNKLNPNQPEPVPDKTLEGGNGLDEEKVAALIASTLASNTKATTRGDNVSSVVNALTEKFGDTAASEVAKVAKEHGMTSAELQELAADKPSLVMSLFGEKALKPQSIIPSHLNPPTELPEGNEGMDKLLKGGITSKELTAGWKAIGAKVHEKYGVEK